MIDLLEQSKTYNKAIYKLSIDTSISFYKATHHEDSALKAGLTAAYLEYCFKDVSYEIKQMVIATIARDKDSIDAAIDAAIIRRKINSIITCQLQNVAPQSTSSE